MNALAYVLLPLSGVVAFLGGRDASLRFHGLQAVVVGSVWPLALYGASALAPGITKIVFFGGALLWVVLMVGALVGRGLRLPGLRKPLERLAAG